MHICQVVGKVVSTLKNEKLVGLSLVLVRTVQLSSKKDPIFGNDIQVAVDLIGCGTNDFVIVTSGHNANLVCANKAPIDLSIVGIIDSGLDGLQL